MKRPWIVLILLVLVVIVVLVSCTTFVHRDMNSVQIPLSSQNKLDWWWHHFTNYSTKGEKQDFFIEYMIMNPGVKGRNKNKNKPSYFLLKCGIWRPGNKTIQLNYFFDHEDVHITRNPFSIKCKKNDCWAFFSDSKIEGYIECFYGNPSASNLFSHNGSFQWNLDIMKNSNYCPFGTRTFLRNVLYSLHVFDFAWYVRSMDATFDGTLTMKSTDFKGDVKISSALGYQDKNWGRHVTNPWIWIYSNTICSNDKQLANSYILIGGANPRVFGYSLGRHILVYIQLDYECIEFNFLDRNNYIGSSYMVEKFDDSIKITICALNKKLDCFLEVILKKSNAFGIDYQDPSGDIIHSELLNGISDQCTILLSDKSNDDVRKFQVYNAVVEYSREL